MSYDRVGHRTAQWDEEIWAWKPGHGPKDTFCAEHSAGRPEAEFELAKRGRTVHDFAFCFDLQINPDFTIIPW